MRILTLIITCFILNGCGATDRFWATTTGSASENCHDGVLYLQFTSGSTVKYNKDGSVATCEE